MPKVVTVDTRGNVGALLLKEYLAHPRKYIDLKIISVGNQPEDVIYWADYSKEIAEIMFEVKLNDDLKTSLDNKKLLKELRFTYIPSANKYKCRKIYLVCGGNYDSIVYARLNGMMNGEFPMVRYHTPLSSEKAIEKILDIISHPPLMPTFNIPVLEHVMDKGFALSISALMDGISEEMGVELASVLHNNISINELEPIFNKYYGKNCEALSGKFYDRINSTWLRDKDD